MKKTIHKTALILLAIYACGSFAQGRPNRPPVDLIGICGLQHSDYEQMHPFAAFPLIAQEIKKRVDEGTLSKNSECARAVRAVGMELQRKRY